MPNKTLMTIEGNSKCPICGGGETVHGKIIEKLVEMGYLPTEMSTIEVSLLQGSVFKVQSPLFPKACVINNLEVICLKCKAPYWKASTATIVDLPKNSPLGQQPSGFSVS